MLTDYPVVKLIPSSRRVDWPVVGFYYEIKGEFKLCISVDLSTGWATFWGSGCQNEYFQLADLGLLTEYRLEACHELAA